MRLYQIVVTDQQLNISGSTFSSPVEALKEFANYVSTESKKKAFFHELDSHLVKYSDCKMTCAVIFYCSQIDTVKIEFRYTETSEVYDEIKLYKVKKGYAGRYYNRIIVFDFTAKKVVLDFKQ